MAKNKIIRFEAIEDEISDSGSEEDLSDLDPSENKLPVLSSISSQGKFQSNYQHSVMNGEKKEDAVKVAKNRVIRFESSKEQLSDSEDSINDIEESEDSEDGSKESCQQDELSDLDISDHKFPILHSIVSQGKIQSKYQHSHLDNTNSEDAEKAAIKKELSTLSFEELQKLKEKIGSKKFNQTLKGERKELKSKQDFKRDNPNRPREISSKSRRQEKKVAIQVPKVFRNDPRFDNLCGEFQERIFQRNYEFVSKIKEVEVGKLKEELKEETNPRRVEKMKYLIQRMENQVRAEKQRKEERKKEKEQKQIIIDALNQGKTPHFASKSVRKEQDLRKKFDDLKKQGKLDQYVAKKRKHNTQRDRRHMPYSEEM